MVRRPPKHNDQRDQPRSGGGYRVEDIEDPLIEGLPAGRQVRYLNKLVDELAKGRAMEKTAGVIGHF